MKTGMICLVMAALLVAVLGLAALRGEGQAVADSHPQPGNGAPWNGKAGKGVADANPQPGSGAPWNGKAGKGVAAFGQWGDHPSPGTGSPWSHPPKA
jgi:hypothetical protein